jgi:dTDP-glucose 4,6-dehydratase
VNFLITGGAGFIGSHFTKMLLGKKLELTPGKVTVVDALTYSGNLWNLTEIQGLPSFKFVEGNICDFELMKGLIQDADVIVNFAAESHVDRSIESAIPFIETNVLGVANILSILKTYPEKIFLQVSTDEVYGSIAEGSWDENFKLAPNSPYAASKASADLLTLAFYNTHGLDVRITRCSNNYGPNQHPEKLIPRFLFQLMADKKVPLYGRGDNFREWIYVADHCWGISKVIQKGTGGEIYNIGSGYEISNLDLTKKILTYFPGKEDYIESVADRKGHDFRYSVNSAKISDQLGFKCDSSFDAGLEKTIKWYESYGSEFQAAFKA